MIAMFSLSSSLKFIHYTYLNIWHLKHNSFQMKNTHFLIFFFFIIIKWLLISTHFVKIITTSTYFFHIFKFFALKFAMHYLSNSSVDYITFKVCPHICLYTAFYRFNALFLSPNNTNCQKFVTYILPSLSLSFAKHVLCTGNGRKITLDKRKLREIKRVITYLSYVWQERNREQP
jgi:hypothetical protein